MRNLLSHFLGNCVSFGPNTRSSFVKKILNFGLKWRAVFWTGEGLGAKNAKNWLFWKLLIIKHFRFLDNRWTCQSYGMRLSKLWNELVTAMLWGRQMPQVSGSKHSYERLRWYMWQFRMWNLREMELNCRFSTRFSLLDWTKKLTRFCKRNYKNYLRLRFLFFLPNRW